MDEEIIKADDLVETLTPEQTEDLVEEVAAANALVVYRIAPPESLSEAEAKIWNRVIDSVKPGWISDKDIEQLSGYCRCVTQIAFYTEQMNLIRTFSGFDPTDKSFYQSYAKWAELSAKAEGLLLSYARALRITNSAFRSDDTKVGNVKDSADIFKYDD